MQEVLTCDLGGDTPMRLIGRRRMLLVCGRSFSSFPFGEKLRALTVGQFSDFSANPSYESVCKGVEVFHRTKCDGLLAVGGGSAIDVAKCIKLFSTMDTSRCYLTQEKQANAALLIAAPTTAGTGSESTHFAVIYQGDDKLSVAHESLLPRYALLDASALQTLPPYQKRCTFMDALCQAIESCWSVNATEVSRDYAERAISQLWKHRVAYLKGDPSAAEQVLLAANLAGRAINLTQTTAAHAMSYRLTKLFQLPHGHAVAICLPGVWRFIANHADQTTDPRGSAYVRQTLCLIAQQMQCANAEEAIQRFRGLLHEMSLASPRPTDAQLTELAESVNLQRLHNTPVVLSTQDLRKLYQQLEEII